MKREAKNHVLENAIRYWSHVAPLVIMPENDKELGMLINRLDTLLDVVGSDEQHTIMPLIDIMSNNIASYEKNKYKKLLGTGVNALKYLMQEHGLTQADLPEIGSQGVVSEILSGKRVLNLRQINHLAKRFHVEPDTFIDEP